MPKFRYYITDTFEGCIRGTNDEQKAKEYAACADFFVVDTKSGKWLGEAGEVTDIQEV